MTAMEIQRITFHSDDAISRQEASPYNVNNLWPSGIPPPDYGDRLAATTTGQWVSLFHKKYHTIEITGAHLRWMKQAAEESYLGRFMQAYEEDLDETVRGYGTTFPKARNPGWFVRTEHVSLKEGVHGVGPYNDLAAVLQSVVTSSYRHRAVREGDGSCKLYLLPWQAIDPEREFRVFVCGGRVTALCPQRWFRRNEWLASMEDSEINVLISRVVAFHESDVKEKLTFLGDRYTFDLAVLPSGGKGKRCYVCKMRSHHPGPFCEPCYAMNNSHRNAEVDMTGKVCIITGCRLKIGYEAALALLRMGATVIGTTRFPDDASKRYRAETDGDELVPRLALHRVDMLCMNDITAFTNFILATHPHVHVVVNNAAQTIRRPPAFYKHLLTGDREHTDRGLLEAGLPQNLVGASAEVSTIDQELAADGAERNDEKDSGKREADVVLHHHFPPGQLDEHGQQVDLRPENSWTQPMGAVDPVELVECLFINAAAPFILVQNLLPLLSGTSGNKFVVNASAMEGRFNRYKTPFHPHTNMAKAALNQWVRTSGSQLAKESIFMTAVDTGWVTDERPVRFRERSPHDVPLDCKDGAMRLLHPIIAGYSGGELYHSVFLKDYKQTSW